MSDEHRYALRNYIKDHQKKYKAAECETLLKPPFHLNIVGSTMAGKGYLLINLLVHPDFYRGVFDKIIIYSNTLDTDNNWLSLKEKLEEEDPAELKKYIFAGAFDMDQFNDMVDKLEKMKKKLSILIIFDDILGDKFLKSPEMLQLLSRGRHTGLSTIISTQSYMGIPRGARLQFSGCIITNVKESELERIAEDFATSSCSEKHIREKYQHVKEQDQWNFLFINKQKPIKEQLYKNFSYHKN